MSFYKKALEYREKFLTEGPKTGVGLMYKASQYLDLRSKGPSAVSSQIEPTPQDEIEENVSLEDTVIGNDAVADAN